MHLLDKAFIAFKHLKLQNMMDIKEIFHLWSINSLIKKTSGSGVTTLANKSAFNNEIKQNRQLAEELNKTMIKNF